jgi:ATPase family AAA domain-containing protein 3A/B
MLLRNLMIGGGLTIAIGVTSLIARHGIDFAYTMIKQALTTPKLIIASSKKSMYQRLLSLFRQEAPETPMIFDPILEARLNKIAKVTSTIHAKIKQGKSNIKYRNLMLYGPPGTGKTMFATELAKRSGLEYAFMSGSSFSKFKEGGAIEALDELFSWANKSNGLLIFIDEAESFLSKRENMDPQSKAYQVLNNFLNYTGTSSNKFMLVFATNHKDSLDSAMYRRINDLVEMPLPGLSERVRVLTLYKNKILMDVKQNGQLFVNSVATVLNQKAIWTIANKTKGLSNGDLEAIINSIKTDADIMEPSVVTTDLVDTVVQQAIDKHVAFTVGSQLVTR